MARRTRAEQRAADEAYLRSQQVTLDQQLAEEQPTRQWPKLDTIPDKCPECSKPWRDDAGVVPMIRPDQRQHVFLEQVQCGGCGNLFLVEPADHERIRVARQEYTDRQRAMRAPLPKKEKRTRGAG